MTRCWGVLVLVGTVLFVSGAELALAQAPVRGPQPVAENVDAASLHLRAGVIALRPDASLHRAEVGDVESARYVVQLDGPLSEERLAAIRQAGLQLGDYLPSNAYIVRLTAGTNALPRLRDLGFVRWVGRFDKSWKLDPEIGTRFFDTPIRQAEAAAGQVRLVVALFQDESLDAALEKIALIPGAMIHSTDAASAQPMIELTMPLVGHAQLAEFEAVQWVEEAAEAIKRNSSNKWILQTYVNGSTTVWDRGIRGQGQVGHVCDGAVRSSHCSFSDPGGNPIGPTHRKILAYYGTSGSDSHGTHVAGTCLGNEQPVNGSTTNRGMAYEAKLVFTNLDTEIGSTNLFTKLQQAHNAGARIHTNSWGNDGSTSYTSWARDVDRLSHTYEDDVVIFAITNINGSVRTPENAKNCIAVAASTDNPATSHCAGGFATTNDGRRKPELMAPGCSTVSSSASTSCGFTGSGFTGTSMAAPAVAGAALLARQYYADGFYPTGAANGADAFVPSGALIRGTLINSAVDLTGIAGFPSNQEGWGRVLLENALYFSGDTRKLVVLDDIRNVSGLTTGQSRSYDLQVNSNAFPLKVTLVWTEKEASLNANPAYINNLNLEVIAPDASAYRGNNFSSGQSAAGGSFDTKNNVEQVLRTSPATGQYTIHVTAPTVNTATPQGFALLVTGDVSIAAPAPTLADVTPDFGDADTIIPVVTLTGTNFTTTGTTTVKLSRSGFPDIHATSVVVSSETEATCALDLSGVELGDWDVVLTSPDAQSATMVDGFEVRVTCLKGDLNGDGFVDAIDIRRFTQILIDDNGLAVEDCAGDVADIGDNQIGEDDISNFVECLLNAGC